MIFLKDLLSILLGMCFPQKGIGPGHWSIKRVMVRDQKRESEKSI